MTNIYVGNLDFNATEDQLRSLFEAHGAIDRVTIVKDRDTGRSRGFGFVEMPNDNEAQEAIRSLNGAQLGQRAITVNEARPKAEGARGGGRGGSFGGGRDRGKPRGSFRY